MGEHAVKPAVIVVHGLYLHAFCMQFWRMHLRAAGNDVFGFNYSSMSQTLSDSAHKLSDLIATLENETVYCVGHSLGGLLIMQMLHEYPQARVRRAVLVGSPYQKAHVPQALARHAFGRFILGKAMQQRIAQPAFPPLPLEIGVIAGSRPYGLGRLVAPGIPTPHDGTVAVAETAVPGLADRIVLPVTHTQMLFSSLVMHQMENFLANGRFDHLA
jgi:pimeloyl-ACP methyl ester carboxylesterase